MRTSLHHAQPLPSYIHHSGSGVTHDCTIILQCNMKTPVPMIFRIVHPYITLHLILKMIFALVAGITHIL